MTAIAVTGGVGYVGRELVRQLAASRPDATLHVIDNLDCGEHRLAAMETGNFALHRIDIRNREATRQTLAAIRPELLYHLAAVHFIPFCERDPADAVARNVAGTVNLLDAMPTGARFVFASTAAVYAPEDDAHVEDSSVIQPMDIYGWTKLHGEQFVRYYHDSGQIRGAVVRLFNVVGSGETNPHLAPAIIEQLDDGNTRVKLGNLFPHRDYIDVSDAAEGFRRIGDAIGKDGALTLSNLGTGQSHAVGDMVQRIADAAGITIDIEQDETRVRAVDRPMLKASTTRLNALTGWTPTISLAEAMRKAWATRKEDRLR
ncbi:MAG: NAD-dependent epimerase/dehydratase family protein [Sphingomonadaceae bacterium]